MRLALLSLAMLAAPLAAAEPPSAAVQALVEGYEAKRQKGEELVVELAAMAARDQFVRFVFIEAMAQAKTEDDRKAFIAAAVGRMNAVDLANTKRLQEILATTSWSELASLSRQAVENAQLIVSHSSDEAFQARMLREFEPLVKTGVISGEAYALLFDDVAINQGRKQRYGTNFDCINGKNAPQPLEDPDRVEAWRKEVGLKPLAEYTREIIELYGACPS